MLGPVSMRTYTVDALVLRTYRYGEADRIVVFLTEDRGKKRGVAKNATVSRRRFGGALEPFTRGRVTYVEREHRELVRLDRIEPRATPLQRCRTIGGMPRTCWAMRLLCRASGSMGAGRCAERAAVPPGAAMSEAFGRAAHQALARYFEYWLLRLEGVYPALVVCPRCGRPRSARARGSP
jgi:DNA repair protein RecO (recombination protein O)